MMRAVLSPFGVSFSFSFCFGVEVSRKMACARCRMNYCKCSKMVTPWLVREAEAFSQSYLLLCLVMDAW